MIKLGTDVTPRRGRPPATALLGRQQPPVTRLTSVGQLEFDVSVGEVVDQISCYSIFPSATADGIEVRPDNKPLLDVVKDALGTQDTAGHRDGGQRLAGRTRAVGRRQQRRRSGTRVVVAYDRNTYTNTLLRKAGIEVITVRGSEFGPGGVAAAIA